MSRAGPYTFYEFFAGGGMARAGLGEGWTCLFANDFDDVKTAAYRANWPADHLRDGDVWQLRGHDLPGQADLAWASSPCQDFSLAGARAGLAGGRSSAFFGFWALIETLSGEGRAPPIIVLENVVGLLSSHGGADFETLCDSLAEQDYRFGAVEIDAARFVPQSRSRIFVVATKSMPPGTLTAIDPVLPFHSRRVVQAFNSLKPSLQNRWIWWRLEYPPPHNEALDTLLEPDEDVTWLTADKATALLSHLNETHREKLKRAQQRGERVVGTLFRRMRTENGKRVQRAELRFDGFAGCLRTPGGGSSTQFIVVIEGRRIRVRRITTREAARLMGLPDKYKLPNGRVAALKIAGDGVVVPVIEFLAKHILTPLAEATGQNINVKEQKGRRKRA